MALFGILLFFVAVLAVPAVAAASDNGAPEVSVQGDITPTELRMSVNCTWHWINWADANTLPPLPGSGWAENIMSIVLPEPRTITLIVTDAYLMGDFFEVYRVDGVSPTTSQLIGRTPMVSKASAPRITDPDVAFATPGFSHGFVDLYLPAGTHYFAFREVGHNWGTGTFFVKCCPGPVGGEVIPSPLTSIMPVVALLGTISLAVTVPLLSKRLRQRYPLFSIPF